MSGRGRKLRGFTLGLGLVAMVIALLVPLGGIASAQPCPAPGLQYPPAARGLAVSSTVLARGETFTATGCADPGATVSFVLTSHPQSLGRTMADPTGFYSARLTIPCETEEGGHTLTASGPGVVDGSVGLTVRGSTRACVLGVGIARDQGVVGDTGRGLGGLLPRTGQPLALLAAIGVVLVILGSLAVYAERRRRVKRLA